MNNTPKTPEQTQATPPLTAETLLELEKKIIAGYKVGAEEALALTQDFPAEQLAALADRLRQHFAGNDFDTCSIMNARSGRCPEDCKWCSQSAFHKTNVDIYPLTSIEDALALARHNASKGVRRFSLVTSGRAMTDSEIEQSCAILRTIGHEVDIELCASMGLLTLPQLQKLYKSGARRYHCNLETAPSFFPSLCTTHTTDDKIATLRAARQAGLEVCSGGIIGMGESMAQRIELALTLRELGVRSIPLNILNPIEGTRLAGQPPLPDDEVIATAAIFRIINPQSYIRFAGGRNRIKHLERLLLHGGINASIVGDMLTTSGSDIETDKTLFRSEGFLV